MTTLQKLTDSQREFAEEHHHLIEQYLRMRRLEADEYYDIVVFRYLLAVQRYANEPKLRQHKFQSIAFSAMRSALYNHFRAQKRPKRNAVVYSLDTLTLSGAMLSDCISLPFPSVYEYVEAREQWNGLRADITPKQMQALEMRAAGYTNREIGMVYRITPCSVSGRISRLRKRVCGAA